MFNTPLAHILTPIILAIIVNGIVFGLKLYKNSPKNPLLPPGYLVGLIWVVIFGLLGYSHYLLYSLRNKPSIGSILIILFIVFALLYPFLTGGLKQNNALLLNFITLIFAFVLSLVVICESKKAFYYLIPLLLWASYVNYIDTVSTKYIYMS